MEQEVLNGDLWMKRLDVRAEKDALCSEYVISLEPQGPKAVAVRPFQPYPQMMGRHRGKRARGVDDSVGPCAVPA
jgi:hypothetical protein